ncbi:hypothetical protein C2E23DRAFT_851087 [Lenzites betulinus]|nr:hypothetical protein C2E23DRAFT_851087 [Lenzites betulinus]
MLKRSTHHRIPLGITLEFLVPRANLRFKSSYDASRSPSLPNSLSGRRNISSRPPRAAPESSSALTSGGILTKLERDVRPFSEQHLSTLSNAQIDAFNVAIPGLRVALGQRDLTKAAEVWSQLKARNLVAFLGPAHHDVCAVAVRILCKKLQLDELSGEDVQLLSEIAVVCAIGGSSDGLRALMLSAIGANHPEVALGLYHQYSDQLHEKEALRSEDVKVPNHAPGVDHPAIIDEPPAVDDEATSSSSLVRDDILVAAIIAHAQLDSFQGALQMFLEANTRASITIPDDVLRSIPSGSGLRRKVSHYIRHLNAAALISRPFALAKHLSNLVRDAANLSLERLYTTAIEGVRGEDHPWLAITPDQLSTTRVILLPHTFWTSFLKSFFACRQTALVERLWDDMLRLGVKPDLAAWNTLLDGYGDMRSIQAVLTTWSLMKTERMKPDALSYRAVIAALFKAGDVDQALEVFRTFERDFLKDGVPLDDSAVLAVYNTTLHSLLFVSREEDANVIKKKMQEIGPKPNIVSYNTFLRYYGRKGTLKPMAGVLQELETSGLKADIYTFSTLLASLLRVRPDADRIVMNFMEKQGVAPDTTALTAIIDHQLQERTPEAFKVAMDLVSKMEHGKFGEAQPNAITYTSIVTAINHGKWLEQQVVDECNRRIWDRMQSRGIQPSRTTYNVLLRTSLANREPEGLEYAMKYYREMLRQRVYLSSDTWYILLKGLVDRRRWDVAEEVVKDMRRHKANNLTSSLRTSDVIHLALQPIANPCVEYIR